MSFVNNTVADLVGDMHYPKSSCGLSECSEIPSPQAWPVEKLGDVNTNNQYLRTPYQFASIETCTNISDIGHDKQPKLPVKDPIELLNPNFGRIHLGIER